MVFAFDLDHYCSAPSGRKSLRNALAVGTVPNTRTNTLYYYHVILYASAAVW